MPQEASDRNAISSASSDQESAQKEKQGDGESSKRMLSSSQPGNWRFRPKTSKREAVPDHYENGQQ